MGSWSEEALISFFKSEIQLYEKAQENAQADIAAGNAERLLRWGMQELVSLELSARLARKMLEPNDVFSVAERVRGELERSLKTVLAHAKSPPSSTSVTANIVSTLEAQVHAKWLDYFHPDYGDAFRGGGSIDAPLLSSDEVKRRVADAQAALPAHACGKNDYRFEGVFHCNVCDPKVDR